MQKNSAPSMFAGTRPQIVATLTATISAISDGMHYGWSAPAIPILQSESSPVKITKSDENWLESIYLIGGIAGLPLTIYLVDKIGRKNSTIGSSVASLISWILIGTTSRVEWLFVARFLSGLAGDMAFVATPMYVAEIADQKIRGLLSGMIYLMMLFGILLIYLIAPFVPFYVPSLVGGALLLIQLVFCTFMPKSPYFLLSKKKPDKARKSLNKLRVTDDNEEELQEMIKAMERQQSEKGRPQDLFLVAANRRALVIVSVLNAAQHFCGISVLLMNLHSILTAAKSTFLTANSSAIIFSTVMLLFATYSSFNMDRYGRKFLLILSSILTGICMFILAGYFHLLRVGYDMKSVSSIPIIAVMVYAGVFKIGLGMVPIVVSAELFSNKVKAMGMTLADSVYLLFGLLSIEYYKFSSENFGYHITFYAFAVFAFLTALFSALYVPETKGKTLEEIQLILRNETPLTEKPSVVV